MHGVLPPLVLAAVAGGAALLVLWRCGGAALEADALLLRAGARAFGPYGARVGAGLETSSLLLALLILAVLVVRLSARSLPRLGGWALPLVVLAGAALQARLSFDLLVPLAAGTGWLALLLGGAGREEPS
jgi:hypothetical protein